MTLLIDARHVGRQLWHGRRCARIKRDEAAKMLNISYADMRRMENGNICIPEPVLHKLFWAGFMMLHARRGHKSYPPK